MKLTILFTLFVKTEFMNSGSKISPKFLTVLSAPDMSIFLFLDDNFNKCQWIFTKLGMCNDIVEIWAQLFKTNDVVS